MPEFPVLHVVGLPPAIFAEAMARDLPGRELRGFEDEAEFAARIGEVEIVLALRPPRGVWAGAERLRLIQISGAGIDALLPAPDLAPGVRVANGRGISGAVMAEYALGWMLHFARRVEHNQAQQARREWRLYGPSTLAGATCGVLGMGAIGEAVAARAKAFGMRVLATQRRPKPSEHADEVLDTSGTERVLAEADYIVVILPLTPDTAGSLDATLLSKMKPEAVLVNMARGGIVDEAALATMLREGRLRGATLDVFDEEPLPESSSLWDTPNLVVTPHVAGFSRDYLPRVFEIFAENVLHFEAGEPLRNEIDREQGY
ncbi:MAG: D-2-hydroxyacid dehydrogenase [Deltaproteobacteria bacterium]|nr:D-2-hydroxyacid dehydrogenase [Deltaproteobacteria bacterium]MBW2448133.1 D-2-hydroxyacid dehydrogenase [Deltaproteobacteria bacterium]